MNKKASSSDGIYLKKKHGQYFLRDNQVILNVLSHVDLKNKSVFEIGCGDGFLTREILTQDPARLWVFEIDPEWADKVEQECINPNFQMHVGDFLETDLEILTPHAPWTVLSNLPYHLTFPILQRFYRNRSLIEAGVLMMQEEVAQKIVKKRGRGYGYISLFFQYYFDWELLAKVPPTAFFPQPKVFSRLIKFITKNNVEPIPEEKEFWRFIKICFSHPRRTLRNNLMQSHIDLDQVPDSYLKLRAQQMTMSDFLGLWNSLRI
jgi:16S rRNA (adenine1518-N6/adenine1519-N6)-dimethyltransferase